MSLTNENAGCNMTSERVDKRDAGAPATDEPLAKMTKTEAHTSAGGNNAGGDGAPPTGAPATGALALTTSTLNASASIFTGQALLYVNQAEAFVSQSPSEDELIGMELSFQKKCESVRQEEVARLLEIKHCYEEMQKLNNRLPKLSATVATLATERRDLNAAIKVLAEGQTKIQLEAQLQTAKDKADVYAAAIEAIHNKQNEIIALMAGFT